MPLNAKLHEVFAEVQIFRNNHFLGKEPAQNILAFRFANGLFEPIWNRNFIDQVSIQPRDVVRGQYTGYRQEEGVGAESDPETFIALKCSIDNWRWAGVPFHLRSGKRLAEGQRIISIAFREPSKRMVPAGSGIGSQGTDHLTFELADASKRSLSFYGKRPAPACGLTS